MTDWYKKKVQAAVPLLQQVEEGTLSAEEFNGRGIHTVSLHYSQATEPEIRYTPRLLQKFNSAYQLKI